MCVKNKTQQGEEWFNAYLIDLPLQATFHFMLFWILIIIKIVTKRASKGECPYSLPSRESHEIKLIEGPKGENAWLYELERVEKLMHLTHSYRSV